MKKSGLFITLEGPDGSGKTTQALLLVDYLKKNGWQAVHTREPGGDSVAEKLRGILLAPANKITPAGELFLYWACRSQHVGHLIKPAIAAGSVVVCERFNDATLAYQGYGRGLDRKMISQMNNLAAQGLAPDLTFLLDIDPARGLRKVLQAKGTKDRFEREKLAFHRRVRNGYLALARREPGRIKIITAKQSIEKTHQLIIKLLEKKIRSWKQRP